MKRTILLSLSLAFLAFSSSGYSEEPAAKMACCQKAEAAPADAAIEKLAAAMNGSVGEEKIAAMAALLNHLVQERKAMSEKMAMCEKKMEAKAAEAAKPAAPGATPPAPAHKH